MSAEDLLAELRAPTCFPHAPPAVEIVQTHLSVVCLAGDLVYKLKKAHELPFVDFSTLAARRRTCRDEVTLNRRLCPDVYLGTAALRRQDGALRFAATGDDDGPDDLDVAVVMRRLPAERMLDRLVDDGAVTRGEIEALARHIAAFHERADRGGATRTAGDPQRLARFAADNFAELAAMPDHGLSDDLLAALARASATDFARLLPTLQRRAAAGRVVDGHGDLHTRNVCMTTPPAVYDCIEFEPAFRCGDVATENAFLVMDLRYRGAPELAAAYERAYVAASGDTEQPALLAPLVAYRAMVRAKVAALAAAEPTLAAADRDGARTSARRHLWLAAGVTAEARRPRWLVVCGPPASGKSSLCRALADALRWPHLATDRVRKELAGVAPSEPARDEHYTAEFSVRTYAALRERAAAATIDGAPVVLLDGNFPTRNHRRDVATAAPAAGAEPQLLFVDVDAVTAAARAAARHEDPNDASDADAAITARLRAGFEPPAEAEGLPIVRVDGTAPVAGQVEAVLRALLDGDPTRAPKVESR